MKCMHCKQKIATDEDIRIYGIAGVTGITTLEQFKDEGVEWDIRGSASVGEYIICPHCSEEVILEELQIHNSKDIKDYLDYEFVSSTVITEEFKQFFRRYRSALKKTLPDGLKIIGFSPNHFCGSGFVTDGEHYVYFSFSDVRHFPNAWYHNILIRTAKHEKDYRGGTNEYTSLPKFGEDVQRLLEWMKRKNN